MPNPEFRIFSREDDNSKEAVEHDENEWKVTKLIEKYLNSGTVLRNFCGPEAQSLLRRYTKRQAAARARSLLKGIEQYPQASFVYNAAPLQRNRVIIGHHCLIDSYNQVSFRGRLYDAAEVILERERIKDAIRSFDGEWDAVRQDNLLETKIASGTEAERQRGYVVEMIRRQLLFIENSPDRP
jgi:hypothetical protein